MRVGPLLVATTTLIAISCSGSSGPAGGASPSGIASGTPAVSPMPVTSGSSYGLYLVGTRLDMIAVNGQVGASAPVAAPSVRRCSVALGAVLQPPVSASSTKVYFRDGDTRIRSLTLPTAGSPRLGQTEDVTTVPGGLSKVSFFSVSPDDKRIAVLVEDMSPDTGINILLYVEDLRGRGNHVNIYSTSTPKNSGTTLWPMGWNRGHLVLAVMPACTHPSGAVFMSPREWHVSSATTGVRLASINSRNACILSFWPSPAGVACVNGTTAYLYDWTGKVTGTVPAGSGDLHSRRSPSGRSIFFSNKAGIGALPSDLLPHDGDEASRAVSVGNVELPIPGNIACLWIDEDHLLGTQQIFGFPSGQQAELAGEPTIPSGVCVGRFPGGL